MVFPNQNGEQIWRNHKQVWVRHSCGLVIDDGGLDARSGCRNEGETQELELEINSYGKLKREQCQEWWLGSFHKQLGTISQGRKGWKMFRFGGQRTWVQLDIWVWSSEKSGLEIYAWDLHQASLVHPFTSLEPHLSLQSKMLQLPLVSPVIQLQPDFQRSNLVMCHLDCNQYLLFAAWGPYMHPEVWGN